MATAPDSSSPGTEIMVSTEKAPIQWDFALIRFAIGLILIACGFVACIGMIKHFVSIMPEIQPDPFYDAVVLAEEIDSSQREYNLNVEAYPKFKITLPAKYLTDDFLEGMLYRIEEELRDTKLKPTNISSVRYQQIEDKKMYMHVLFEIEARDPLVPIDDPLKKRLASFEVDLKGESVEGFVKKNIVPRLEAIQFLVESDSDVAPSSITPKTSKPIKIDELL